MESESLDERRARDKREIVDIALALKALFLSKPGPASVAAAEALADKMLDMKYADR